MSHCNTAYAFTSLSHMTPPPLEIAVLDLMKLHRLGGSDASPRFTSLWSSGVSMNLCLKRDADYEKNSCLSASPLAGSLQVSLK